VTPRAAGAALAVLAALLVLGGCSKATDAGGASATATRGAPLVSVRGGTVAVDLDAVPMTLNDHTVPGDTAATRAVASLIWPQVFQVAPGVAPALDTEVVQSAEVVSIDPQTVVYQINPKAQWSDGTPITAQDFVYAWVSQDGTGTDVDGAPDSVASVAGYDDISSVTGSNDGRTVTVVFQSPYADWMSLFDDLLPAHVAEKAGWNSGFDHFDPAVLVSGGPFMVGAWTPGVSIVLVRNPRWWGTPPQVDRIVVRATRGAQAMAGDLTSGSAQVAAPDAFDQAFEAAVSSSPDLESALELGTTSMQLAFDVRRAPFDDAQVRQGIAHELDRAALVTDLLQPIDPLVWVDNDHLFANADPWYADDAPGYDQADPIAAAKDLGAGGLVADARGTWSWHGSPLVVHLAWNEDDPWSALAGPALAAQLVASGFDVASEPLSAASFFGTVLPGGHFDLALVPLDTGPYPSLLAPAFGTPAGEVPGAVHDWSGFDDPKVDALFAQAAQQLAATPDRALYQQIDAELWNAMPTVPLFAEPQVMAWSASLTGVKDDAGALGPLWSAPSWAYQHPAGAPAHSGEKRR
jgi:peptide/nickel transport system substrate-binding protein